MRGRGLTKWTRGALLPSSAFFFLLFLGDGLGPPGASPHAAVPPSAWRECLPVLGHGKKTHPPATAPQQHLAFFPVTRHSHAFFFSTSTPQERNAASGPDASRLTAAARRKLGTLGSSLDSLRDAAETAAM